MTLSAEHLYRAHHRVNHEVKVQITDKLEMTGRKSWETNITNKEFSPNRNRVIDMYQTRILFL